MFFMDMLQVITLSSLCGTGNAFCLTLSYSSEVKVEMLNLKTSWLHFNEEKPNRKMVTFLSFRTMAFMRDLQELRHMTHLVFSSMVGSLGRTYKL